MDDYEFLTKIGSGSYGTVYKVLDHSKSIYRAVKKFKKSYSSIKSWKKEIEVELLPKLKHPNIISLSKIVYHEERLYLIMELASTDLGHHLQRLYNDSVKLTEEQIRKYMKQIVKGVAYIHSAGYIHRDLKPENILLAEDKTLKIGDVGTAKSMKDKFPYTNYVSTRWYRAPEWVLSTTDYTPAVDVFAIGWIMAELYTLRPVFWGKSSHDQLVKYWKILGTSGFTQWKDGVKRAEKIGYDVPNYESGNLIDILHSASSDAIHLLKQLLQFNPAKRIKINDILEHPFFGLGSITKLSRTSSLQGSIKSNKILNGNWFDYSCINKYI